MGDCISGTGTGDTIAFSLPLRATIRLALGELAIAKDVIIVGPGAGSLAIDGLNQSRVFHITAGSAVVSSLTIQRGRVGNPHFLSHAAGGGVMVDSGTTLSMTNCTLRQNQAISGRYVSSASGGGIDVAGEATLTNCTLNGNRAIGHESSGYGGGVMVESGASLNLTNCTLRRNRAVSVTIHYLRGDGSGGGIQISGTAILTDCTLTDNIASGADGSGGGINVDWPNATATFTNCRIIRNRAIAYLSIHASSAANGGGMLIGGTAVLDNCTFSENKAIAADTYGTTIGHGGGMLIFGMATLNNCTLTGNRTMVYAPASDSAASAAGGAIAIAGGTATLTNCTLSGNRGWLPMGVGGIDGADKATLTNTIVANNGRVPNCSSPTASGGHNLSSDNSCFAVGGSDLSNANPMLTPLGNYGGATQTMALCTGPGIPKASCTAASPAIDAGDDSVTSPPDNVTTDQRGQPRLSGAHVDIGAYEVQQ